jgi:hypothetical protein
LYTCACVCPGAIHFRVSLCSCHSYHLYTHTHTRTHTCIQQTHTTLTCMCSVNALDNVVVPSPLEEHEWYTKDKAGTCVVYVCVEYIVQCVFVCVGVLVCFNALTCECALVYLHAPTHSHIYPYMHTRTHPHHVYIHLHSRRPVVMYPPPTGKRRGAEQEKLTTA